MTNDIKRPEQGKRLFAVQPASWAKLDGYGCEYATNMGDAYKIAGRWVQQYNEDCIIWKIGTIQAMRWVRVSVGEVSYSAAN